jgi:hypothetical protein
MTDFEVKDVEQQGRRRVRYTFRGVIQGVGFRPTAYRCALRLGLAGLVRNQRSEVVAEIEGETPTPSRPSCSSSSSPFLHRRRWTACRARSSRPPGIGLFAL